MKSALITEIIFIPSDFEQPFTNALCCPLATAIKRILKVKEVNVGVLTVNIDDKVHEIQPPFTYERYLEYKRLTSMSHVYTAPFLILVKEHKNNL